MKPEPANKKFIFNERIDKNFIFSMYEDDYVLITEVFTSSLESIDEGILGMTSAFASGDTLLLKKASHKLKPVFGFTGLLAEQDAIGNFENACENMSGIILKDQYEEVLNHIKEGRTIIEQESGRLQQFTGVIV